MTFESRPYDLLTPPAAASEEIAAHPSALGLGLNRVFARLAQYNERRLQRMILRSLDDHLLSDIGLSCADVSRETAKRPWQPCKHRAPAGSISNFLKAQGAQNRV